MLRRHTLPESSTTDRLAYSAAEMAAALGLCEKSLLQSSIPRVRLNRRVLFAPDAVRKYLAEHSVSPAQSATADTCEQ